MNVFDDEAGPLASDEDVERVRVLFLAGLSLREVQAFAAFSEDRQEWVN